MEHSINLDFNVKCPIFSHLEKQDVEPVLVSAFFFCVRILIFFSDKSMAGNIMTNGGLYQILEECTKDTKLSNVVVKAFDNKRMLTKL